MRIESVTAHAFGPLAGETLELAPGLTVVAGVNESAKSSWHAALYAALCGRTRGDAVPTLEDRRLVDRYKPWDGAPWLLSSTVVLDDGRRLQVCQDLDGGDRGRVVDLAEDGEGTDVTSEVLAGGAPDASRWLGLGRAAFAAVALVNQAEHRLVRDAADGLQQYLRRAAENARGDTATPALTGLDKFLQDRLGRNGSGPLPLAQERLRLAREGRVVARRGHEQYLADLATVGGRRAAAEDEAAKVRSAESSVRALEQVHDAARTAEEARATAERSRSALTAASSAAEEAAARAARVVALQDRIPEQNTGRDEALVETVTAARSAWDAAPVLPPLDGPCSRQLQADLATLPANGGVEPLVRELADAHRAALAAAEAQPGRPVALPTPRPSPTPSPRHAAAPVPSPTPRQPIADPAELRQTADALEAPRVIPAETDTAPEVATLASAVEASRTRHRAATEAADAAEKEAAAAEERYQKMRAEAAKATARRPKRVGGPLRALAVTIVGVGLGLAALYFGLLAALVLSAIVILPIAVSLLGVVALIVRAMRRAGKRTDHNGRPVVEDLVGAIVTVREKKTAAERARAEARAAEREAAECRSRHVTALRGERMDPAREAAVAWCARHGLRAEPAALRGLADRIDEQAAGWTAERARLAAAVAETGDALRAALRERGILDQGSPLDQFTVYASGAGTSRRTELERALAARLAAEETAAQVVAARRDAAAQLQTAAYAVGLDTSGDPDSLARALDGWREARAPRTAVAVADRPWFPSSNGHNGNGYDGNGHNGNGYFGGNGNGHGRVSDADRELAALLGGGSAADLRRREEELRAERDERLAQAWSADLTACEARQRRDDLAKAAGIDPVRAGDRAYVARLVDEARAELTRARTALTERGTPDLPEDTPDVARAEEEVDAAEEQLRRLEQLRRTTSLTRRFLARAQEQAHRDVAPVLASTLRGWLPGVTRGRYSDALVDPETLAIQVYGPRGRWRPVDTLSAGTADQVYLLLRVAMAQHLATTGETCPLLLDGVTAQADGERRAEILDLLLKLAAERQVVLFTQEQAVLDWAHEHLDGDRHRVRELAALPVG